MAHMTTSLSYIPRNPKFTDALERQLANDEAAHLRRREPSLLKPALLRLGAAARELVRLVHFLRASAQRPPLAFEAS
jgi:hypothetical protein